MTPAKLQFVVALVSMGSLARASESHAQAARMYTLDQAVTQALASHPRIRAAGADESAASARIDEARTARLPDAGVSAQLNRSTGNTVPGAFFPIQGFAPIAGPTRGKSIDEGSWQTGVSAWATWDVLSVARQAAAIDVALASHGEASAATSARKLEVAYRAADAFIALLEAQEVVRAAQASVDRAQTLATITKPLVDQTLRPGADLSRADAEVAAAQTLLARAEQARGVRRAELAEALGDASARVDVTAGALLAPVDGIAGRPVTASAAHPEIAQANAAVTRAASAQSVVQVEYLPRLDVVAAIWARGSGIFNSPAAGLVPDTPNWAVGATLTWSVLDIPTIRARARSASAAYTAAIARRDETQLAIAAQLARGSAILDGALRVARQTPATLQSARVAQQQATARYKTGLSSVVDVADAERILTQAEIDDALARLEVRRALLLLARASGDLSAFLAQARAA